MTSDKYVEAEKAGNAEKAEVTCEGKVLKLTFKSGKFVFTDNDAKTRLSLKPVDLWKYQPGFGYCTVNLKAAFRYAEYADDKAQRIFNRAFVKRYLPPSRTLPPFLDPHQVDGVSWVLTRSRSYLAHAPGAGKTAQAIVAALYAEGKGQNVFIVPPSLTVNWEREIVRFYGMTVADPGAWPSIAVIPESKDQEFMGWKAEWLIVPDSMLTKEWVLGRLVKIKKKLVAVDEASRFKDSGAERTKALFGGKLKDGRISHGLVYDARHAVLLDGSPMPNRPMELWAPTYAMFPEAIDFMSQQDFGFRYCGATINDFGRWEFKHSANESELKERLQKDFMHVVGEGELSHPERRRSILMMSEDARSPAHRTWERKHLHRLNLGEVDEKMNQGEIASFRRELGIRKVRWVSEYVADRLASKDESILIFAWHREVCIQLLNNLIGYGCAVVMGGTEDWEREKAFAAFQAGDLKVLVMNIAAAGRGHNLQKADRIIFAEFSWTDELNKQCEKRASRRGRAQEAVVRCEYVVSPNSMDEPILNSVFRKAEWVRKVIG